MYRHGHYTPYPSPCHTREVRLLIARCSVHYVGRLESRLDEATRLIMVKADGCVAIHADGGAYKPLNWMNSPNTLQENEGEWIVANPKGESITITLHEIFLDTHHHLGDDPGLSKDGVEAHLQELLRRCQKPLKKVSRLFAANTPQLLGQ
jgi:RecB family endonuclease NucS